MLSVGPMVSLNKAVVLDWSKLLKSVISADIVVVADVAAAVAIVVVADVISSMNISVLILLLFLCFQRVTRRSLWTAGLILWCCYLCGDKGKKVLCYFNSFDDA